MHLTKSVFILIKMSYCNTQASPDCKGVVVVVILW